MGNFLNLFFLQVECEILIPAEESEEIVSRWNQCLSEPSKHNRFIHSPYIRNILDEFGLVRPEHLGSIRWATLEYTRSALLSIFWSFIPLQHGLGQHQGILAYPFHQAQKLRELHNESRHIEN